MPTKRTSEVQNETQKSARLGSQLAAGLLAVLLASGCASDSRNAQRLAADRAAHAVPPFLGPAASLLTNAIGYSAHAVLSPLPPSSTVRAVAGKLFVQGTRLVFTPTQGRVFFIWDASVGAGYVLNEALQAYAPAAAEAEILDAKVDSQRADPLFETIRGHPCKTEDVIFTLRGRPPAEFTTWRAAEFKGVPLRIKSINGSARFTMELSDVRLESPPSGIFMPPQDFTKYASTDSMMVELISRRAALSRKNPELITESAPPPSHNPRGQQ